jgi:hypothetical protein
VLHVLALAVTAVVTLGPSHRLSAPVTPGPLSEPEIAHLTDAPERRVRAFSPHLRQGIAEGLRRSSTFAALVQALQESDVIVQIVDALHLPASVHAQLTLTNAHGMFRFVRIEVGYSRRGDELIALLGHELQHALELAMAPDVRSAQAMSAHFARIGYRTRSERHFDTHEAHVAERRIRRELGERRF